MSASLITLYDIAVFVYFISEFLFIKTDNLLWTLPARKAGHGIDLIVERVQFSAYGLALCGIKICLQPINMAQLM